MSSGFSCLKAGNDLDKTFLFVCLFACFVFVFFNLIKFTFYLTLLADSERQFSSRGHLKYSNGILCIFMSFRSSSTSGTISGRAVEEYGKRRLVHS